ncbi:MAG: hypothetical protein IJL52_03490 [Clostridia bacterium]|nr:hypothetical protein [Clostridia bacterium]
MDLLHDGHAPNENDRSVVDALLKKREPHGALVRCVYRTFSMGMMNNSDTLWEATVTRDKKSRTVITLRTKEALRSEKVKKFRPKSDLFAEIEAFVEAENLAALAALECKPSPFEIMDYSSSAYIALYFEDPASKYPDEKTINIQAMQDYGVDRPADTLHRMITDAIAQKKQRGRL